MTLEAIVESYFLQQAKFQQRVETNNRLNLLRTKLAGVINSNIQLVQGFASFVSTRPDIDQQFFARIGRDITRNSKIIRNIAAAPDMVISLMYPMQGNEAAMGLDYNKHSLQRSAALKVIETGKLVLAGSVQLKQGDQFSMIINIDEVENLKEAMERILATVSGKYVLESASTTKSASIGVAIFPNDATSLDSLLGQADLAMYTAKQKSKQQYYLFDSERDKEIHAKRSQQNKISAAISNDEMLLYQQPKISIEKAAIYGAEGLIRWDDPEQGIIYPLDFLRAIQRCDVQCQLDLWVVATALQQAKK